MDITQTNRETTLFQFVQKELEETYPSLTNKKDNIWQGIVNMADIAALPAHTPLLDPDTPW